MSPELQAICLAAAFVCFILAAVGAATRVALVPLGLALWVLVPLVAALEAA